MRIVKAALLTKHYVDSKARRMRLGGVWQVGRGAGDVHTWFWGENQRNERIGRNKRAWEDNIQMEI